MYTLQYYNTQKIRWYQKLVLRYNYTSGVMLNTISFYTLLPYNPDTATNVAKNDVACFYQEFIILV